jgi:aminopeptidase
VSSASGPDPETFARLLCDWCLEPAAGDQVLVSSTTIAEPIVLALHRALLARGAWPLLRLSPPALALDFYRVAGQAQLDGYAPIELAEAQAASSLVRIDAPANTRALAEVDPVLIARAARARSPVQEARLASRWCGTLWPTAALAQQAGMSEGDYAAFVARALFLDRPDPVAAWRELSARQAKLVQRLSEAEEIHIEAEGTDLRLRVGGRTWVNSDGRRNMPSGEIFTGPHEDSAEGTIRFTIPTGPSGVSISGVELTFKRGEVVAARAERGEDYLRAALDADAGARFLGELGIGTNPGIDRATGHILLDEKIAGTVHLAIGRSYPETGGTNVSSVHWDMICDLRAGGRLTADGQMLNDILWSVS